MGISRNENQPVIPPQQAGENGLAEELGLTEEPEITQYLAELNEAARQVITPRKTEDLLLRIKVDAFKQAAVESHQSGDDTLTNLVIHREELEAPEQEAGPWGRRRRLRSAILEFALPLAVQIFSFWLVFSYLVGNGVNQSGYPDTAIVLSMIASFATASVVVRRGRRRPPSAPRADGKPVKGLACEPAPLSKSRRMADIVVACVALVLTLPFTAMTGLMIALGDSNTIVERKLHVGQGGHGIFLLRYQVTGTRVPLLRQWLPFTEHFPRLWNLLRGDLTLVGPKPEPPEVAVRYPEDCRWVFQHRPGLIGAVFEDTRHLERNLDEYLSVVVPAQVKFLYRNYLYNSRLGPRLLSNAAFALLAFQQGKGPRLATLEQVTVAPADQAGAPERPPAERVRLERWSLHETALA
ncbi:sugar transferase [Actinacidiphila glaucinigra]|uniref:Sugar transferase n=1 Tax=Actinacidiphila glaucinigra TaxID=235986 RepID=A0A239NU51_9ACTN|nr:sugar transferase [Actinacidiphila glaucinigra]SNT58397.1 sugar transferase [Actinacidiphila glaucinigra]